jgi:hypothetical protein
VQEAATAAAAPEGEATTASAVDNSGASINGVSVEAADRTKAGSSGISSGIRLENVRSSQRPGARLQPLLMLLMLLMLLPMLMPMLMPALHPEIPSMLRGVAQVCRELCGWPLQASCSCCRPDPAALPSAPGASRPAQRLAHLPLPRVQIAMTFKNQQVLKDCSWECKKGERVGLVGRQCWGAAARRCR